LISTAYPHKPNRRISNLFFAMSGKDDIAVVSEGLVKVDPNCGHWLSMYELSGSLSSQLQEITTKDGSTIEMETTA
jgi:hypothetical protein